MPSANLRDRIASLNVLVVGDVMLDEYWFGDVRRISPEAPVPIVHVSRCEERPGGAANVARNVVSLGARATLLAVVGADATADRLRRALDESGVRHHLSVDSIIRTTLKLRVIGQHQQMLRVDFEEPPSSDVLLAKQAEYTELLAGTDVVVLSDYGKGALAHVADLIALARKLGKPVLVDPKGRDYRRYAGATTVTPNLSELADTVGIWSTPEELDTKAEQLRAKLGLEVLVVTMSEQGMKLYAPDGIFHQQTRAQEVFDVSGAGDTVIAALAVMRGTGVAWESAVTFANAAGGVAVGKLGTSVVEFDEVERFLQQTSAT
ncbi:rfaE bifunctional protein kinase chain/domain [Sphingopyxis panaciterrae]|uniref:D-glycero-beta-D-manno-heptose-7-phosphate kinase n=1 Tax=Sphingopyxis panaciterrae TaxID=363841 RepID=UPI0014224B08|nr:D-glycero-beta-D-manno-heptose-7-phosphate kinase [Sphingopyxis panaciterrae]NIJ38726.1 rfaE bifunctional protein kinase chain/domain [Sphingopyxis panaciterrae]